MLVRMTIAVSPLAPIGENRPGAEWWRSAVIYQVYPRSFADANGDGMGDLAGVTAHLDDLVSLGIDAIWLSPFYTSPQNDAGYDVADYCDIDPRFGTLADFDRMLDAAHARGIRVVVDLVPNHSSSEHEWFQAALAAGPGSRERARYLFRDGTGENGELPPNNWQSVFGGPAWTRVEDGQWYLHLFDATQPDFDWNNPEVHEFFKDVLRFWLDRGVDGFRVDVAHGLVKDSELPDHVLSDDPSMGGGEHVAPYWGQEAVHDIYREWNAVLREYDGDRALCAEAWLPTVDETALWVRQDEMHQAFNFPYLTTRWDADDLRHVIAESLRAYPAVGAPATWVLSNHDVIRHATRLALTSDTARDGGIGPRTEARPIPELGQRRARAATTLMLALPGSAYLFQGEELGLPEVVDLADEVRQDPTWFRTNGEKYGRDGCRVPLPWVADAPAFGFNDTGASWLPQPAEWARFARDVEENDPASTLWLYRALLANRRQYDLGAGSLEWLEGFPADVIAVRNGAVTVIVNLGTEPVALPSGTLVVASEAFEGGELPADTAVWLLAD